MQRSAAYLPVKPATDGWPLRCPTSPRKKSSSVNTTDSCVVEHRLSILHMSGSDPSAVPESTLEVFRNFHNRNAWKAHIGAPVSLLGLEVFLERHGNKRGDIPSIFPRLEDGTGFRRTFSTVGRKKPLQNHMRKS